MLPVRKSPDAEPNSAFDEDKQGGAETNMSWIQRWRADSAAFFGAGDVILLGGSSLSDFRIRDRAIARPTRPDAELLVAGRHRRRERPGPDGAAVAAARAGSRAPVQRHPVDSSEHVRRSGRLAEHRGGPLPGRPAGPGRLRDAAPRAALDHRHPDPDPAVARVRVGRRRGRQPVAERVRRCPARCSSRPRSGSPRWS